MSGTEQRITDLEQQVAGLAARTAQLEEDAFVLMTIEQMIVKHAGYPVTRRAALETSRPRHLQVVTRGGVR